MEKLQLPHAKLLYFVSELWKQQEIRDSEKLTLKERIISDEPKVFEILDNYESNGNLVQLKTDIIGLVRANAEPKIQSPPAQNPSLNGSNKKKVEEDDDDDDDDDEDEEEDSNDNVNVNGNVMIPNLSAAPQDNKDEVSSPLGNALFNKKKTKTPGIQALKKMMGPIGSNY